MTIGRAPQEREIVPPERPTQLSGPQLGPALVEVDRLIRAGEAREKFGVDGAGLAVAVLDTGLRTTHVDFAGRVIAGRNFTSDNGADPSNVSDGHGHGTNVTGIIAARGDHLGVATGASVIPLKVQRNDGKGSFDAVLKALEWVRDNREAQNISAACLSLGGGENYQSDDGTDDDDIRKGIQTLRGEGVAVVIAAGNDFFKHGSIQGMSYPAIIRECVSVGAVYDEKRGGSSYPDGSRAYTTAPDRITPFSQRLHDTLNPECRTDIFAPGARVVSSGISGDRGESSQSGTSQATPVTVGVVLLLQQFHRLTTGRLPSVDDLVGWMRQGAVTIRDADEASDNVAHTGLDFQRVDAVQALETVRRHLQQ